MSTSNSAFGASAQNAAAIFVDRESAADALTELHHAGFRQVWLGVTRAGAGSDAAPTIESDNLGGFVESMGRFFSGEESRGQALHEALVAHGLTDEEARRIDTSIAPGNAVVIVDGENDLDEATAILEETGGALADAATAGGMRPGAPSRFPDNSDDVRRIELREERLAIDKERVQSGEARIGKRVLSEQQSFEVPVFHEELYVERGPALGNADATSTAPIGAGEEIRVPLTEERIDITKATVVREKVAIGKRRVEGTDHIGETVKREELVVDESPVRER